MTTTKIEWTEKTWNPVAGCTPVSPGCLNCYAATIATRQAAMGREKYGGTAVWRNGRAVFTGRVNLDYKALEIPRKTRKPTVWFVNSMSDLFHEDMPLDFLQQAFRVMNECPQHQFQVLTKRPERAVQLAVQLDWTPNIWMGTSIESADYSRRSTILSEVPAAIRFLSVEPMLGPMADLPLEGIQWVIIGCESGAKKRSFRNEWATQLIDRCHDHGVEVFVKQILLGKKVSHEPTEWPVELSVRGFPLRRSG